MLDELVAERLLRIGGPEACIAAGLIGGEGFAVDASLIVADANKQRSIPGKDWDKKRDPATASRAVKEYLATMDNAAFGAASDVTPKFVSPADPAAQWTGAMRGPAFFACADNYLIDVKFGIIMDVEASRAIRQAEVGAARTMIERTEERFGVAFGETPVPRAGYLNLVCPKGASSICRTAVRRNWVMALRSSPSETPTCLSSRSFLTLR